MRKRLMPGALLVVMAALSLHDLVGMAQRAVTPPGKFIASAEARFPGKRLDCWHIRRPRTRNRGPPPRVLGAVGWTRGMTSRGWETS